MNVKERELKQIGESLDSLTHLNSLVSSWGEKRGIYIIINRVSRTWMVYALFNSGQQIRHEIGLGVLEKYFDEPVTMLNKLINEL